jgi:hypothetical protein
MRGNIVRNIERVQAINADQQNVFDIRLGLHNACEEQRG